MNYTLQSIHQLDAPKLRLLAELHLSVMETLLTDLGLSIVARYYEVAAKDENVIGICAINDDTVLGWVVGSPYPQALNNRLRSPLPWFIVQMLQVVLTHPRILLQLITSARSAGNEFALGLGELELTYIGVAPEARSQKLGFALLQEFINASRVAGYQKISLSVETENAKAVSLYERNGFRIRKAFTEGNYDRYRMDLELAPAT